MDNRYLYFAIPTLLLFLTGSVFLVALEHDLWKEAWMTVIYLFTVTAMCFYLLSSRKKP